MTPKEVTAHFGDRKTTASALGITPQAIVDWYKKGCVPFNTQYRIQVLTNNALIADGVNRKQRPLPRIRPQKASQPIQAVPPLASGFKRLFGLATH